MAFEQRGIKILHMHVVLYSLEIKVHILDHASAMAATAKKCHVLVLKQNLWLDSEEHSPLIGYLTFT